MGHRDHHSTLVYITVTQDLLQEASERFRAVGARCLTMEDGHDERQSVPRVVAGVLPGMVGRATQCFDPYDPLLSRHLAAAAAVHRGAKGGGVARGAWPISRPRGARVPPPYRAWARGTIGTRNCRLAAIRSFFSFVADKDPEYVAQCARS
jgi:hypothetical protein